MSHQKSSGSNSNSGVGSAIACTAVVCTTAGLVVGFIGGFKAGRYFPKKEQPNVTVVHQHHHTTVVEQKVPWYIAIFSIFK